MGEEGLKYHNQELREAANKAIYSAQSNSHVSLAQTVTASSLKSVTDTSNAASRKTSGNHSDRSKRGRTAKYCQRSSRREAAGRVFGPQSAHCNLNNSSGFWYFLVAFPQLTWFPVVSDATTAIRHVSCQSVRHKRCATMSSGQHGEVLTDGNG